MYGGYGTSDQGSLPLDPLTQPLPVAAPAKWTERERRVEWCMRNLTRGEKALLYRMLHDTERLRLDQCAALERAERHTLT